MGLEKEFAFFLFCFQGVQIWKEGQQVVVNKAAGLFHFFGEEYTGCQDVHYFLEQGVQGLTGGFEFVLAGPEDVRQEGGKGFFFGFRDLRKGKLLHENLYCPVSFSQYAGTGVGEPVKGEAGIQHSGKVFEIPASHHECCIYNITTVLIVGKG